MGTGRYSDQTIIGRCNQRSMQDDGSHPHELTTLQQCFIRLIALPCRSGRASPLTGAYASNPRFRSHLPKPQRRSQVRPLYTRCHRDSLTIVAIASIAALIFADLCIFIVLVLVLIVIIIDDIPALRLRGWGSSPTWPPTRCRRSLR